MVNNVDKNSAFIDYILQCPQIVDSPLYFNFINAKDNNTQIITNSDDRSISRPYVDGSVKRRYTFTIIQFKSITDIPIVKFPTIGTSTSESTFSNENVDDLADMQALIDWISEQEDLHNYPNFGDNCEIDEIRATTDSPRFDGINTEINPNLAMYSIDIEIEYIDTSKVIWNR